MGAGQLGQIQDLDITGLMTALGQSMTDYSLRYSGYIEISTAGTYTFETTSNDGSKLYIDGELVVDNDGAHIKRVRSGSMSLSAGKHRLVLVYFQRGGSQTLRLKYSGADTSEVLVDPLTTGVITAGGQATGVVTVTVGGGS